MQDTTAYRDRFFSILGDSISTFEGVSLPQDAWFYDRERKLASGVITPRQTWWGQVIEGLGGRLLMNNAISGSTVAWHPLYEFPSYGCSRARTSSLHEGDQHPDVIMVLLGTNDWGRGTQITYEPISDRPRDSEALFSVAYDRMLERLRESYPNAAIWCFTLPVSRFSADASFSFPYRISGRHIDEYCEVIRASAAKHACRLVDLRNSASPYDTVDGFHPNADGMKTLADAVLREV